MLVRVWVNSICQASSRSKNSASASRLAERALASPVGVLRALRDGRRRAELLALALVGGVATASGDARGADGDLWCR